MVRLLFLGGFLIFNPFKYKIDDFYDYLQVYFTI